MQMCVPSITGVRGTVACLLSPIADSPSALPSAPPRPPPVTLPACSRDASPCVPAAVCLLCCCCSVTKSCLTLYNPMDCSTPGFPVLHHVPEFTQTHVHGIGDAIQPSHPLSSPSPPAFNLSQHQGLFQWVSSWHQVVNYCSFSIALPMNIQDWFPSGLTGWISLQS